MRNYKSKDMLIMLLWKEGSLELPWEEVKRTNIYSFLCITKESRYVEGFFWHICLCFDNREDCYSHRHSTNSALFFSQLLAHCFNVDFSFHPKIIDKLRTIQVILERIEICRSGFFWHICLCFDNVANACYRLRLIWIIFIRFCFRGWMKNIE